jgi:hypothetical protein
MNRVNVALHAAHRYSRWVQVRLGVAGVAGIALLVAAGIALTLATVAHREAEWLSAAAEQARARPAGPTAI